MAKVKITGHASGTGVVTVTAPNTSTDRTITLPDTTGTLLDENSSVPAANLTGTVADARISALTSSKLTGALPAISAANLTGIPAANITGTLPAISGANLTGISGGKVLQVVEGSGGNTAVSTTSDTYINHIVTITPSSTNSKVMIFLDLGFDTENANAYGFTAKLTIDNGSNFFWAAGSNGYANNNAGGSMVSQYSTRSYTVLHSPSSTSALSYKVYVKQYQGTVNYHQHAKSRIFAMEIGA